MNSYETVNKIITFIDERLKEDISIYEIAQHVNFSVPHTYRLFRAITGETIKSYLTKRKLYCAAKEISSSRKKIADIAFDYGFESHDVFTRAFIRTFDTSPSKCRSGKIDFGVYQLSIHKDLLFIERSKVMKYSIINKKEIYIIGMECDAIQWDADGAIGRLWSGFLDRVDMVLNPVVPNVMYGLCEHDTCSKDNTFTYLAGIEVEEGCLPPKGMVRRVVKAQKYLLVEVPEEIKTPDAYTKAFEYIKVNGLEVDDNDEIEVYEEIFKDPDNNSFKLLLPIK